MNVTLNGTAIRALREAQSMSIRQLAHLTGLNRGNLSRLERGLEEAGEELVRRIAEALGVPPADITKGDPVPTEIPDYWTEEGKRHHYTPEQISEKKWLPWSARTTRRKASAGQIPHCGGGRGTTITLTGENIAEINADLAVRPINEQVRPRPRSRAAA